MASVIVNRYVKSDEDSASDKKAMYIDASNLYGSPMSQQFT